MISKCTEAVCPPGTKISAVWSFIKGLTVATCHYYVHEFGTSEWWEGRHPGDKLRRVDDMPVRLKEYELEKTIVVAAAPHYIFLVAEHDDFQTYLEILEEKFACQILKYCS